MTIIIIEAQAPQAASRRGRPLAGGPAFEPGPTTTSVTEAVTVSSFQMRQPSLGAEICLVMSDSE